MSCVVSLSTLRVKVCIFRYDGARPFLNRFFTVYFFARDGVRHVPVTCVF